MIELLLAMALFALLAVGSARVLDVVMRAERARQAAEQLHALGRAMSLIQRDALQGYLPASLGKGGYGILLNGDRAHWLTREPDHQALKRSELRVVEYWLAAACCGASSAGASRARAFARRCGRTAVAPACTR